MQGIKLIGLLKRFARVGAEAAMEAVHESRKQALEGMGEEEEIAGVKAPRLVLTNPASMNLDRMDLTFKLSVDVSKEEPELSDRRHDKTCAIDVTMSFAKEDPPEGLELVRDHLNKKLAHELGDK